MSYNLIDEPWIPVLWAEGTPERVGIRDALEQAGRIREIAASNPMDNVSLLRLLLAVLQWCKPTLTETERGELVDAEGITPGWLGKLDEHRGKFNLLGEGERFYQDSSLPKERLGPKQDKWDAAQRKKKTDRPPTTTRPTAARCGCDRSG